MSSNKLAEWQAQVEELDAARDLLVKLPYPSIADTVEADDEYQAARNNYFNLKDKLDWEAIARALLPVVIAAEKLAENDANFRNRHNTCMCCGAVNIHMDYCEVKILQTALAALEGVKE